MRGNVHRSRLQNVTKTVLMEHLTHAFPTHCWHTGSALNSSSISLLCCNHFLQIHSAAVTVIEIFFGIETFFRSCLSVLEKSLLMWPFFISDTKSDYLLCFQSPYRSDSSDQPSVQSLSETFQCQIMVFMFFFSIFGQVKPAIWCYGRPALSLCSLSPWFGI